MNPRRFRWLLAARGPALDSWPAPDRAAALLLLRHSAAARNAFAEALTDDDAPAPDGPGLARLQHAVRRAVAMPAPVERGVRWGMLAACGGAGLFLGVSSVEPETLTPPVVPTVQSSLPATVLAALDP